VNFVLYRSFRNFKTACAYFQLAHTLIFLATRVILPDFHFRGIPRTEFFEMAKPLVLRYTQAVLKFPKLNTQAQQREAVVQGRSLSPYRLQYIYGLFIWV
jgi:hypothetical protein